MSIPPTGVVPLLTAVPGRAPVTPGDLVVRIEARLGSAVDELEAIRSEVADAVVALSAQSAPSTAVAPKLLTVAQAATVLGVGQSTVHNLIRTGQLGSRKIGGSRRIPVADVDGFIARLPSQGIGA
jgi:excisionase family DNA binding protein